MVINPNSERAKILLERRRLRSNSGYAWDLIYILSPVFSAAGVAGATSPFVYWSLVDLAHSEIWGLYGWKDVRTLYMQRPTHHCIDDHIPAVLVVMKHIPGSTDRPKLQAVWLHSIRMCDCCGDSQLGLSPTLAEHILIGHVAVYLMYHAIKL